MFAKVGSAAVLGIEAFPVEVEVYVGPGDTRPAIVGLPDTAVKESMERVGAAMSNSGFSYPLGRLTVNLAPADIRKEGPSFDLPIALGILASSDQLVTDALPHHWITGELALDGAVRPVKGMLSLALRAKAEGKSAILVPADNAAEAAVVQGLSVIPVRSLRQAVQYLEGETQISATRVNVAQLFTAPDEDECDFAEVKGQETVKRALEIAAAGGHNLLMIGPPGTGKSMLARRLPSILPPLTLPEALETTRIHSIVGLLPAGAALVTRRPFRSPHHTASDAGLLGGNVHPTPGEISLAHHGILFLDELPEFKRSVLETLRQPLEEGVVTISRAAGTMTFPAQFMLVAAMNPTPDGKMPAESRSTPKAIARYLGRISGPLLDRIDIHVEVPRLDVLKLSNAPSGEDSATIRARVLQARGVQQKRFAARPRVSCNARMTSRDLRTHCKLDDDTQRVFREAVEEFELSARAFDRVLRVSRTIADLAGSDAIQRDHLWEAVQFRSLDRQLWT